MGKKRNNKKKIENKCANVSNIETMTDKENPESIIKKIHL